MTSTNLPAPRDEPKLSGLLGQLQALGQARDGMIVAIALIYLLGFVSWTIHSWRFQIGFTRILDAQYLAAGVLPSVSLLLSYGSWRLIRLVGRPENLPWALLVTLTLAMGSLLLGWFSGTSPTFNLFTAPVELSPPELVKVSLLYASLLMLIPAFLLLLSLYLLNTAPDPAQSQSGGFAGWFNRNINLIGLVFFGCGFAYCVAYTILLYILVLYPNLPQEIGGARPRCGRVMFDPKKVPTPLLDQLGVKRQYGWSGAGLDESTILEGARIIYNGEKELVFTTPIRPAHAASTEVSKDLVVGIVDCSE